MEPTGWDFAASKRFLLRNRRYTKLHLCHCEKPFGFAQDKLRDAAMYPMEPASHSFAMTPVTSSLLNATWFWRVTLVSRNL